MNDKKNIPGHIAIIMDGNGRWAKERGLPRTAGHRAGMDRVREIIKAADGAGVKILTLFAFSTENWLRSKKEVNMLMRSLNNFLGREIKEMDKNNIKFIVIGRAEPLPKYLQKSIKDAMIKTQDNTGLILVLALNYGARQEIIDAAKKFAQAVINSQVKLEELGIENFGDYFYTAGVADPDFLIRTSGEMRLSNFLLWQLSYAELYFPKKYWPDFRREDLEKAIKVYQGRARRFGKINVNKEDN